LIGEWGSEQKGIDAESHIGFFDRLVKRREVSKSFAEAKGSCGFGASPNADEQQNGSLDRPLR